MRSNCIVLIKQNSNKKRRQMINRTIEEEKQYLEDVIIALREALRKSDSSLKSRSEDIMEHKEYLWNNIYDLDPEEVSAMMESIKTSVSTGENMATKNNKLRKLIPSPYFARIDFKKSKSKIVTPVYIGMYGFIDETKNENVIYDWRAPISSMFYDFELGNAFFISPSGKIEGEIDLKRQYTIKNCKMEFMLESSVAIGDEILQHELNAASDEKMKGIVATIQREQNKIIRNESAKRLIIQGVAGSGKSSIALHRVAFLLYKHRETISSKNILIISPNKVFADYISNVLPELGEEKILEISFEDIAKNELKNICKYQTFFEQVEELVKNSTDKGLQERIKFKSSFQFADLLRSYVLKHKSNSFKPKSIKIATYTIPASFIIQEYYKYSRLSEKDKEIELLKCVLMKIQCEYKFKILLQDKQRIRNEIRAMFQKTDLLSMYEEFYKHIGKPELFVKKDSSTIEYSDVFPLICLKFLTKQPKDFSYVKHLLVDEMQDYTPIQYFVLSMIFKCDMTILGDSYQSVNPYSSSSIESISKVFPDAECMKLCKSYRSTFEITEFAQKILKSDGIIPFERHGSPVVVQSCASVKGQLDFIVKTINEIRSKYKSIGIICKTQEQADLLYEALNQVDGKVILLNSNSMYFANGVVVTSIHMSKGLEFDGVIIPDVTKTNYHTEMDKNLLYIACTREMHYLSISYIKTKSSFI